MVRRSAVNIKKKKEAIIRAKKKKRIFMASAFFPNFDLNIINIRYTYYVRTSLTNCYNACIQYIYSIAYACMTFFFESPSISPFSSGPFIKYINIK